MNFNSLNELYERIYPALDIKSREYGGIVSPKEIWNYFSKNVWPNAHDLTLAKIVDDILKCDISKIKILGSDIYDK